MSSEKLFANILLYIFLLYGAVAFIAWDLDAFSWGKTERVCLVVFVSVILALWPLVRLV